MIDKTEAVKLLNVAEKLLDYFCVEDAITGKNLEGFICKKPDYRYGALAIIKVDGRTVPQRVLATPKMHYPFNRAGEFHFPPIKSVDIYEKLDGTNILAYQFHDANGNSFVTYKLRLWPVLRNGKWGAFLDMWREILSRYPQLPLLPVENNCSISFELYGSRNLHLMLYETSLDCAVLFGVDDEGRCRHPFQLDCLGVPIPEYYGRLLADNSPREEYDRIRGALQSMIRTEDDGKLSGLEGTMWYVTSDRGNKVIFKCKPESVEAIHWKGRINKIAVTFTCWNLLETTDMLSYENLEPLLLEEYPQADIDKFKPQIAECILDVVQACQFQEHVLQVYRDSGLRLAESKRDLMRLLSNDFNGKDMRKVFNLIRQHEKG